MIKPYQGNKPFVFVSYSHEETEYAEKIIGFLARRGVRIWYDDGINLGTEWKDKINERMKASRVFLGIMANGTERRTEVLREIRYAIKRQNEDNEYNVVFIFLEKMPANCFSEDPVIEKFIKRKQFVEFNGFTEKFAQKLLSDAVCPRDVFQTDAYPPSENLMLPTLADIDESPFFDSPYILPEAFPKESPDGNFYRVEPEEIDVDAATLMCLDNQWCPPQVFENETFWKMGFTSREIRDEQSAAQKRELTKALLHNRQLVINRAFFFNSQVFGNIYHEKGGEFQALQNLLEDGSLLVFLSKEAAPWMKNGRADFSTSHYEGWGVLCETTKSFCLRMDWANDDLNAAKVEKLLFNGFQRFCLSAAENNDWLQDVNTILGFSELEAREFENVWRNIQLNVSVRERDEYATYTRELFYKRFLIRKGTEASDCLLDARKPFVKELKEIIDYQYDTNLANALGIRAIAPTNGIFSEFHNAGLSFGKPNRGITVDEISYAIFSFEPIFLHGARSLHYQLSDISLTEAVAARSLSEWKNYIRNVSNSRKRAKRSILDLYEIESVWRAYQKWVEALNERRNDAESWMLHDGCISVVIQINLARIILLYSSSTQIVQYQLSPQSSRISTKGRMAFVSVSYLFTNVFEETSSTNPFQSEILLFEGTVKETADKVFSVLEERLSRNARFVQHENRSDSVLSRGCPLANETRTNWRIHAIESQDAFTEEYQNLLSRRRRSNSTEWVKYSALMKENPELFRDGEAFPIITDFEQIFEYEQSTNKADTVGVRYESPYRKLVVDLVKNENGEPFLYERIIPSCAKGAVVCIPKMENKFLLIEQYRHALRGKQLCFPRGFGETGLSSEENAIKELEEELGCNVVDVVKIGEVIADSGTSNNQADVFLCKVANPKIPTGYEGILRPHWVTLKQLSELIRNGKIDDGFTLAAFGLLQEKTTES